MRDKIPFEVIHADYCSPGTVDYKHSATGVNIKHQILLLTIVDVATGWPEFNPLLNHTAEALAKGHNKYWFCCYPQPRRVFYDNGSKFLG